MTNRFAIFLSVFALIVFAACGNDASNSSEHEGALPHNMEQSGNTTEAENDELAAASGKSATLIAPADLLAKIKADTTGLLVVNFWKTDCLKCIQMQQAMQELQNKSGENKLHLLSVNLDDEQMANGVNLVLRKSGMAAEVLQVKDSDGKWRNDISGGWQGNVPAVFIKSKDGIKQFYPRDLTAEELGAMLQPLLL
jgi:thiol-disulfide isomerase/thioredoxin